MSLTEQLLVYAVTGLMAGVSRALLRRAVTLLSRPASHGEAVAYLAVGTILLGFAVAGVTLMFAVGLTGLS